jgi:hypothetical protein
MNVDLPPCAFVESNDVVVVTSAFHQLPIEDPAKAALRSVVMAELLQAVQVVPLYPRFGNASSF